jgi:predicted ribosome quality control (RQC) complex YloA/Tae2 family protein
MTKSYSEMTADELSQAKQALDAEIQKIREQKKALTEVEKREGTAVNLLNEQLTILRAKKADIQREQEKFAVGTVPGAYTLGVVSGVDSAEAFGTIGG